eukprot:TRINITY_DN51825_c0_g2_i1.p1 TRINITY_DN51825_c0_g2~~TRINITY_DN51825_c0_g2_i1.p1  ORF type:complete len:509 (-),score=38.21 TRINITY_DN51825_c0_g2_i1:193-1629(-)
MQTTNTYDDIFGTYGGDLGASTQVGRGSPQWLPSSATKGVTPMSTSGVQGELVKHEVRKLYAMLGKMTQVEENLHMILKQLGITPTENHHALQPFGSMRTWESSGNFFANTKPAPATLNVPRSRSVTPTDGRQTTTQQQQQTRTQPVVLSRHHQPHTGQRPQIHNHKQQYPFMYDHSANHNKSPVGSRVSSAASQRPGSGVRNSLFSTHNTPARDGSYDNIRSLLPPPNESVKERTPAWMLDTSVSGSFELAPAQPLPHNLVSPTPIPARILKSRVTPNQTPPPTNPTVRRFPGLLATDQSFSFDQPNSAAIPNSNTQEEPQSMMPGGQPWSGVASSTYLQQARQSIVEHNQLNDRRSLFPITIPATKPPTPKLPEFPPHSLLEQAGPAGIMMGNGPQPNTTPTVPPSSSSSSSLSSQHVPVSRSPHAHPHHRALGFPLSGAMYPQHPPPQPPPTSPTQNGGLSPASPAKGFTYNFEQ